MNINCLYQQDPNDVWMVGKVLDTIVNALTAHYDGVHTFTKIDTSYMNPHDVWNKFGYFNLMLQNPENNKYIVITFWDKMFNIVPDCGWDTENIVEVLASSGVHDDDHYYTPLQNFEYTPFTYPVATQEALVHINNLSRPNSQRVTPDKLSFKGALYQLREVLSNDDRFDVTGERVTCEEYISDLNNNSINLSLNGSGETCFRDMEVLGLGSCLIRPKLVAQFDDPLIPNYHYISVDFDHLPLLDIRDNYVESQADVVYNRWLEVKDDTDFINEVAKNGKEWFDRNVPPHKVAEKAVKLLDFDKLK